MLVRLGAFILLFLPAVGLSDIIREGTLEARSNGSSITVSWVTDDEQNVVRFEIERRLGTASDFMYLATVQPKGPSLYEFADHSALKIATSLYQYRIKVVFSGGRQPLYVGPVTVSHTVSGVRKTWGSIKAMFR